MDRVAGDVVETPRDIDSIVGCSRVLRVANDLVAADLSGIFLTCPFYILFFYPETNFRMFRSETSKLCCEHTNLRASYTAEELEPFRGINNSSSSFSSPKPRFELPVRLLSY